MAKSHPYRAVFLHSIKVSLLGLLALAPLALIAEFLPRWVFLTLFFAFGVFVFMPAVFGVGPIGRLLGKQLNESAISHAREKREALAPELIGKVPPEFLAKARNAGRTNDA